MFFEHKEGHKPQKPHKGSLFVGYDLGEEHAQISYCVAPQNQVETLASVAGTKQYNIPVMLCKRKGANQWIFGREAAERKGEEGFVPVEGLLTLARKGEALSLDGAAFDPVALLTLFVRRSLSLLSIIAPLDAIYALLITAERMDERMVEILLQVAANLHLKTERIFFQSHREAVYAFLIQQEAALWAHHVLVCEHDGRLLRVYRMACNRKTRPVVAMIEEQIFENLPLPGEAEGEEARQEAFRLADERFFGILEKLCTGRLVSSAYLCGEGFREEWHKSSLRFLCRGRRVFQGNNLFSQGAVHSLLEKTNPSEVGKAHVFLGENKLKANVGMWALRQGKEDYCALLDAGENWYDARNACEVFLKEDKTLTFAFTPLTGKNPQTRQMALAGAGETEAPFMRYALEVSMSAPDRVQVLVRELGLGEFFPGSGQTWEESFQL